jgi:hypothetical protein
MKSTEAFALESTRAREAPSRSNLGQKVWIDLDNSPHVPFFLPIIRELEARGCSVVLTARDAFQVKELIKLHDLDCECIGHHHGKNMVRKILGVLMRAVQLSPTIMKNKPDVAVAHGSRAQLVLATVLGIPSLHIGDYEHATTSAIIRPSWVLVPELIPLENIRQPQERILQYPGIKEDVYVPGFTPDPRIRGLLGLHEDDIVVTVRPPASEAHYHNPLSDELFHATMEFLKNKANVRIILLPRNDRQAALIRSNWPLMFDSGKAMIPAGIVDGLNLIWFSDLVISGGGTMNREAAALGVPVFSIFRGKTGAVDKHLSATGRLVMIENPAELQTKVQVVRRQRPMQPDTANRPALQSIVDHILALLGRTCRTRIAQSKAQATTTII